ncbi:MAG: hypothetical protein GX288_01905 [Clostridiales bacterium]|nr:hypothetical protein [Clostridiales bacterium]
MKGIFILMKIYHLVLAFVVLIISTVVIADIKTDSLMNVINEKESIDRKLRVAIDDGISNLLQIGENNQLIVSKEKAIDSFYASLYTNFGILSDKGKQAELSMYIPIIAVTEEDGYYIYYYQEYISQDGGSHISQRWSEKLPYYYEDEDFIYGFTLDENISLYDKNGVLGENGSVYKLNYKEVKNVFPTYFTARPSHFLLSEESFYLLRKGAIQECIESTMAYHTSLHNHIASQYGITYNFALPQMSEDIWMLYLDNLCMFVVFQGYPYGNEVGEVYNRIASAGAKISKDRTYYLEQVKWYLVYHISTCPKLKENILLYDNKPYYSIKDCVAKGAYGCEICCPNEIHAPDYTVP